MNVRRRDFGRARSSDRRRGAVMVEFALIIPVIMTLLFGLVEFGFAFRDGLTVASAARAGARVGANLGDDPATDYNIVISVQAALAELPGGTRIIKLVVYKPIDGAGNIDPSCMTGAAMTAGGVVGLCNVYDPGDISGAAPGWFGCTGADRDQKWCPTTRDRDYQTADWLGVYVEIERDLITDVFPSQQMTVTQRAVMRLEPDPNI